MELIKSWAMGVAGVVVFCAVCEMLLPKGNMKKYVRLALGVLMILTILSPLIHLIGNEPQIDGLSQMQEDAYVSAQNMDEKQRTDTIRVYNNKLSQKIQTAISEEVGAYDIEVRTEASENPETFGEINRVLVMVNVNENNMDVTDGIVAAAVRVCGIQKEKIDVEYIKQIG